MVLFEFIKWKIIDLYKEIVRIVRKEERKIHLYGIYGFFGLPGKGKTMAMVYVLNRYRKKYKDRIYIMTNFHFKGQDFEFKTWKDLMKEYDKPLVVAWDEVQNEFNSRDFRNFPVELLTLLTQNRKGNGKQILYTAQRWNRVDKVFRELTHFAVECNTIAGRLTRLRFYHWEDYEQLHDTTNVDIRMRIRPVRVESFVQTDEMREMYDSYKMLESAKSKEYIDRVEMAKFL
jgi:hypothetical protein